MSIHLETTISLPGVKEDEMGKVIEKVKEEFYQEIDYRNHDLFTMSGRLWAYDEDERDNQILKTIWGVIGRYVPVDIEYRWIEQVPIDEYSFDERKYKEIM